MKYISQYILFCNQALISHPLPSLEEYNSRQQFLDSLYLTVVFRTFSNSVSDCSVYTMDKYIHIVSE